MDINIPEVYKNLLKRVEEIEETLSKSLKEGKPATTIISDHAEDKHAQELDDNDIDDLTTEKVDPVVLSSRAYLKLAIHAKKYANPSISKKRWVEVIGLLTGHVINENTPIEQIIINDAWPVGHGDAVSVQIMETGSVTRVMQQIPKEDFIIGWYHSHPSYTPFMSTDDYDTQARYQALWSKAIALVIDPTMITPHDYGFGIFRNTNKEPGSKGYTELSTIVDGIAPKAAVDTINLIQPALEGKDPAKEFIEYE